MSNSMLVMLLLVGLLATIPAGVQSIGVSYGMLGDNLPKPSDVVEMYKSYKINRMRIYYPDQPTLQALSGSNIDLVIDVGNEHLPSLAGDRASASGWVRDNIQAYPNVLFRYITVGNEVVPGDQAQYVLPAMQNIQSALSDAGLNQIKVSTSVSMGAVRDTYPPSSGTFTASEMPQIVQFLANTGAPLLVNVYPYLSYVGQKDVIDLDYALFKAPGTVVHDDNSNLDYQNLFDAMVDAVYSALEKTGAPNVPIVVSESGWPSAGGDSASVDNAQTYNQNLVNHVGKGTPKRPGELETYIFAMFNENKKSEGVEQHWGLFYPDQQRVYTINF